MLKQIRNIYIHIPFCSKKCSYCDFPVYALGSQNINYQHSENLKQQYIDSLNKEIGYFMNKHQESLSLIETLYFGGGSPSLISPSQLNSIVQTVKKHAIINDKCEMTVEIDPGTFDSDKLDQFKEIGVSRISMGVQTLNEQEFNKLGRGHQYKDIMNAVNQIHKSKFTKEQVTIDLMMGIPNQTIYSYQNTLEKSLEFGFGHQSFYMLTLEQNTPFHKKYAYDKNPLPITDEVANMFQLTHNLLTSNGFNHYEVSNYARNESLQSKHNMMYWEGDQEYMAFGCGAASYFKGRRFTRPRTLKKYYQFVEQLVQNKDIIEQNSDIDTLNDIVQTIIMCQLRKSEGLRAGKLNSYIDHQVFKALCMNIKDKYGHLTDKYFSQIDDKAISLSPVEGFLVSNSIISDILLLYEECINNNKSLLLSNI